MPAADAGHATAKGGELMTKGMGLNLASLMMLGALAGCQAKYESDARVRAATQNAESAASRAETASHRAEQAVAKAEAAAQRAEQIVEKMESQQAHARGRR
jgi:Na+-transporting methylmalonyl-CoA/oxaloacetate decarboxylase gamma subunit